MTAKINTHNFVDKRVYAKTYVASPAITDSQPTTAPTNGNAFATSPLRTRAHHIASRTRAHHLASRRYRSARRFTNLRLRRCRRTSLRQARTPLANLLSFPIKRRRKSPIRGSSSVPQRVGSKSMAHTGAPALRRYRNRYCDLKMIRAEGFEPKSISHGDGFCLQHVSVGASEPFSDGCNACRATCVEHG